MVLVMVEVDGEDEGVVMLVEKYFCVVVKMSKGFKDYMDCCVRDDFEFEFFGDDFDY